jgi:hypothetical protein
MANTKKTKVGFDLSILSLKENDFASIKFLMLIEGQFGIGVKSSIDKYGYTEARYYQLLKVFKEFGLEGLFEKKTGPKKKTKRTEETDKQILRLRFLNPNDSAVVIAQKLSQQGISISVRSVERTITEYGIQKKTAINLTPVLKK